VAFQNSDANLNAIGFLSKIKDDIVKYMSGGPAFRSDGDSRLDQQGGDAGRLLKSTIGLLQSHSLTFSCGTSRGRG